jgi:hypothetical protein
MGLHSYLSLDGVVQSTGSTPSRGHADRNPGMPLVNPELRSSGFPGLVSPHKLHGGPLQGHEMIPTDLDIVPLH